MASHRLSKSRFAAGLQCHRRLWWTVHDREAPELVPGAQQQWLFDHGHRVGEAAQEFAGPGTLIRDCREDRGEQVADTANAVQAGAMRIFEASFAANGVFVAVDVLERVKRGWRVVEVKSSTKLKPEHVPDVAVQVYVLEEAGLKVAEAFVMTLNKEHRHPDAGPLFVLHDVLAEVRALLDQVGTSVDAQRQMLAGGLPIVSPGKHCTKPYECPFLDRCCQAPREFHVSSLYRISSSKRAKLLAAGAETIEQIPAQFALTETQSRQRRAVMQDQVIIEPGLVPAIAELRGRLGFLDFETVGLPLPVWNGTRPWEAVPVQFAAFVEREDGLGMDHHEYLASGDHDPRPELAARLVDALTTCDVVLAWNSSFEIRCIRHLAEFVPTLAPELEELEAKIADLLPIVRKNVYHPKFGGSFSIKAVLPALVPAGAWAGEVSDGRTASILLERLLLEGEVPEGATVENMRQELLEYCRQDTLAMAEILARLRELAG